MYIYIDSEPGLYTVGFYDPSGKWYPESDWNSRVEASNRVNFLNGGNHINTKPQKESKCARDF